MFADPGAEEKDTYLYIDYIRKTKPEWYKRIRRVTSKYGNIFQYYFKKKTYPSMFKRDCTPKFKIIPIKKDLESRYPKGTMFEMNIFYTYDEIGRMFKTSDKPPKGQIMKYPLIDRKITRDMCKQIVESFGMLEPVKSGCFFCFFKSKEQWLKLKQSNPDQFKKVLELEKRAGMRKKEFALVKLKAKDQFSTLDTCGCQMDRSN